MTHGIAQISPRRIAKLNSEVEERTKLCLRCGGQALQRTRSYKIKGVSYKLTTVVCIGGNCEICGLPATQYTGPLTPHEKVKRSAGGIVSLDNSIMCHVRCHPISKPQLEWIK